MSAILAYACLQLPRAAGHLTPIWLPNAVLLAVLLLSPRKAWTAQLAAGVAGILAGHLAAGSPPARAAGLTMINGFEVLLAARLLLWRFGGRPDVSQPRTSIHYGLLAAIPAAIGAATASLFLRGLYGVQIPGTLLTWGLADFAGLITVTPSIIALATEWRPLRRLNPWRFWPLVLLAAVAAAVFWEPRSPHSYLVAAALMLVSYRLQLAGAAAGLFIAFFAAVAGTLLGHGPFASSQTSLTEQILSLQLFIAVSFHLSIPVALYRQRSQEMQAALNRALLETRIAEAKYRQITEAVQDLIVQTDRDGRFLYVSPSISTLGYAPEKLVGRSVFALVHPDDRRRMRANRNDFFAGGAPQPGATFRLRVRTRAGDYRLFQSRPHMIRDEAGAGIALESVLRDVTEAVAAEEAMRASEARYRLLSEHMSDIVACYGRDGVIRYVSPSIEGVLGFSPDELMGRPVSQLLHAEDVEHVRAQFAAHRGQRLTTGTFKVEFRAVRKDRSVAWLEAHPRAIFDPDTGEFLEWQDVIREIDERKALEAELTSAKVAAEAAAHAKAEFLANMSHELRTPLTGVLGFTKLASAAEGLAEPARTYVQRVDEASKALLALLSDILDFSKLEAGDVRFRRRPVDLSELARASLRLFEAQADEKGICLEVVDKLPPGLLLELDSDRMRQVLLNLIGNAVKFTASGVVTLRLGFHRASGTLSVSVSDTGPGIAKERLPELFKRFSQVHDGGRRYGGTGLGLAICRGILEAQGGRIAATSKLGEGSCFHFKLPTRVVAASEEEARPRPRQKISVLVADDGQDSRDLVALFLKDMADVSVAVDGRTALRMAGLRTFDVILLDVRMPGLGGPQVLQRIRTGSGPNRTTTAIALTADSGVEAADRLRAQGFAAVIPKTFLPVELISAIAGALTQKPDREPEHRSETGLAVSAVPAISP